MGERAMFPMCRMWGCQRGRNQQNCGIFMDPCFRDLQTQGQTIAQRTSSVAVQRARLCRNTASPDVLGHDAVPSPMTSRAQLSAAGGDCIRVETLWDHRERALAESGTNAISVSSDRGGLERCSGKTGREWKHMEGGSYTHHDRVCLIAQLD